VAVATESSSISSRDRRVADAALLMVTVLWATSFPLIKGSMGDISPILLTGFRFVVTALLMWPMLLGVRADRRAWLDGALLGLLLFGSFATQVTGLRYTTAGNSAFVTATTTPMVPIMDYLLRRRRPSLPTVIGIVVALGGVWLLSGGTISRGDWWTLACAVLYAIYMIRLDVVLGRSPYQVVLYSQIVTAGLLALAASPLLETPHLVVSALSIRTLVLLSLGATAGALYLQNRFQSRTTPTRAALIFTAEPVFAAVFSYFMLGETLPLRGYFGAALIIGGILVSELL
jgi:drug/metabolite transporter (DMT)-like permease